MAPALAVWFWVAVSVTLNVIRSSALIVQAPSGEPTVDSCQVLALVTTSDSVAQAVAPLYMVMPATSLAVVPRPTNFRFVMLPVS